jgi:hypothetical protein
LLAVATGGGCVPPAGEDTGSAGFGGTTGVTGQAGTAAAGGSGAAGTGACATPGMKIGWSMGRDSLGTGLSCAEAGAATVDVFMDSTRYPFPCGTSPVVISPLAPKAYSVRVLVLNAQGQIITPVATGNVIVGSCGTVDIGVVKFTVLASTGGGGMGGNIGGAGSSGAGGTGGSGGGAGTTGAAGAAGPCDVKALFASHSCTIDMACHDNKGSAAGFDMVTAGWEKAMIGRVPRAGGAPGLPSQCIGTGGPYLVAGSNPARGLFLTKLGVGAQPCGQRMPLVPPYFTTAELACIQTWANGVVSGK